MQTIIRRKRNGVTIQYTVEDDPTPGTLGSHQLLLEQYRLLEKSIRFEQLLFNTYFLRKMKAKYKKLHCVYCGKKNLKIYHWKFGEIEKIWQLPTILSLNLLIQKYLLWMRIIYVLHVQVVIQKKQTIIGMRSSCTLKKKKMKKVRILCISKDNRNENSNNELDYTFEWLEVGKVYDAYRIPLIGDYVIPEFGTEIFWEKENFQDVTNEEIN